MTHDLLELAEECEAQCNTLQSRCNEVSRIEYDPLSVVHSRFSMQDVSMIGDSINLHKEHSSALRAAHEELEYFNRFRDELQATNTKLTLENRELRELVKRYEDALDFVASNDDDWSPWRKGNGKVAMIRCGETIVRLGEHDTPLAAIESAMKEEKA